MIGVACSRSTVQLVRGGQHGSSGWKVRDVARFFWIPSDPLGTDISETDDRAFFCRGFFRPRNQAAWGSLTCRSHTQFLLGQSGVSPGRVDQMSAHLGGGMLPRVACLRESHPNSTTYVVRVNRQHLGIRHALTRIGCYRGDSHRRKHQLGFHADCVPVRASYLVCSRPVRTRACRACTCE